MATTAPVARSPKTVKRRLRWSEVVSFPENPIYPKRLITMDHNGNGYNQKIVGSPAIADNSKRAFPEFPPETLFVLDGNHRRALAAEKGLLESEILIDLHRGLTIEEMHEVRRGLNDRRTVKPAETFMHRAAQKRWGMERKVLNIVEGMGWRITYERQDGGLACTNELLYVFRHGGEQALTRAITSYERVWRRKASRSQARVIKGLGVFWVKYPGADMDRLVDALKGLSVDEVYRAGRATRETLTYIPSLADGIRYTLAQHYNQQSRRSRLDLAVS